MSKKDVIRLRARKLFSSSGLQTLYTNYVEQNSIYCLEQIAWEIDLATSGGNTRCRLYIDGHGYKHFLDEQLVPVANWLYTYTKKPHLYPGERLALEIDQGQASTTAELDATGYWEAVKE